MTNPTEPTEPSPAEPSPAELGDTITVAPGEWTPLDDHIEVYLYGDQPAALVVRSERES